MNRVRTAMAAGAFGLAGILGGCEMTPEGQAFGTSLMHEVIVEEFKAQRNPYSQKQTSQFERSQHIPGLIVSALVDENGNMEYDSGEQIISNVNSLCANSTLVILVSRYKYGGKKIMIRMDGNLYDHEEEYDIPYPINKDDIYAACLSFNLPSFRKGILNSNFQELFEGVSGVHRYSFEVIDSGRVTDSK